MTWDSRDLAPTSGSTDAMARKEQIRQMAKEISEPEENVVIARNWAGGTTKWLRVMGGKDMYRCVGEYP